MERWIRRHGVNMLLLAAVSALVALTVHWAWLLHRNELGLARAARRMLDHDARAAAKELGSTAAPPRAGAHPTNHALEIVRVSMSGAEGFAAAPRWPGWVVRPRPDKLAELDRRLRRRQIMVVGEGGLAALLVCVCIFMLYRLVRLEHRHRREAEFFLDTVTHELKSPVTGLIALIETLKRHDLGGEQTMKYLGMGLGEANRLKHLVDNCLLAARMRNRTVEMSPTNVPLGPFLRQLIDRRRYVGDEADPTVELVMEETEPKHLSTKADPERLMTILENLVDNALKHGKPREPDESQDTFAVIVRAGRKDDKELYVNVEDNGRGFPPDLASRLFEGMRLEQDRGDEGSSMGLGLSIARNLARMMDGELTATSPGPGKGAVFHLTLPSAGRDFDESVSDEVSS